LNGRREVLLVLNRNNGRTRGSHVNFTCNKYFRLLGKSKIACIDGKWEEELPICNIIREICTIHPWNVTTNAKILAAYKIEFKHEINYHKYENITTYIAASYYCKEGFHFHDKHKIGYKAAKNALVAYKNITCIDREKWESPPECIRV
jgi:hypothetical protein